MEHLRELALAVSERLQEPGGLPVWTAIVELFMAIASGEDATLRNQASDATAEVCLAVLSGVPVVRIESDADLQLRVLAPMLTLGAAAAADVQLRQLNALYKALQSVGQAISVGWSPILDALAKVRCTSGTPRDTQSVCSCWHASISVMALGRSATSSRTRVAGRRPRTSLSCAQPSSLCRYAMHRLPCKRSASMLINSDSPASPSPLTVHLHGPAVVAAECGAAAVHQLSRPVRAADARPERRPDSRWLDVYVY